MIGIFPRFDYFTAMFGHHSIKDVLSYIDIDVDDFSDCFGSAHWQDVGYDTQFVLTFNSIQISISKMSISMAHVQFDSETFDQSKFFDTSFDKLRLCITGKGLDYLRSKGYDVETQLRIPFVFDRDSFSVTRVDIAYDFVNIAENFYDDLFDYLYRVQRELGRNSIPLIGYGRHCNFSLRSGDNKTIYLGSVQSDRLLRIYDKKFQLCKNGVYTELPYFCDDQFTPDQINSWIRLEWQLRREEAESYLYSYPSTDYFNCVLQSIHDKYLMKDLFKSTYIIVPVDFWDEIMDWDDAHNYIIQNAKSVQCKSVLDVTVGAVDQQMNSLLRFVSVFGFSGLIRKIKEYASFLTSPCPDEGLNSIRLRKLRKFLSNYNEIQYELSQNNLFLHIENNTIKFKE